MTAGLDVIIRLDDASDLPRLDRALFTVFGQKLALPFHMHLMLARFSIEDLRRLRQVTEPLRGLSDGATISVHNWQLPKPLDVHVPLLNWGLELAAGRYFTVLEVSDLLGAGTYGMLLGRLHAAGGAIAVAPLLEQRVEWWGDSFIPAVAPRPDPGMAGASAQFAMLFMLDRSRVTSSGLVFKAGEAGGEIAGFIERVDARYRTESSRLGAVVGVRQIPN